MRTMKHDPPRVKRALLSKLQRLPAAQQAEVLDFVDYLAARTRRKAIEPTIYAYSAGLVKRKGLRKLSLKKIAALVHEVRHAKDSARGL